MKKYIFALLSAATFMTSGCDSILERPELTKPLDETYGKTDNEYHSMSTKHTPFILWVTTIAGAAHTLL